MFDSIKNFPKQFEYESKVVNGEKLSGFSQVVSLGMGGSHLAADIIKAWKPGFPITIHSDYGLPPGLRANTLVIASSYSGNTEEVIDGLSQAIEKMLPVATISVGGKLLEIAKQKALPYIQLPDTGIQPRQATGFSLMATFKLIGAQDGLKEAAALAQGLDCEGLQEPGKALAKRLKNGVPVIYSSNINQPIAYNWKIKFNETGKIPAFYNVFPESNHNEMTGFDAVKSTKKLSAHFHPLFLLDDQDHPLIQKRMTVVKELYRQRGLKVDEIPLLGESRLQRIFSSTLLADWVAYHISQIYGVNPNEVPMVEQLKKLIV